MNRSLSIRGDAFVQNGRPVRLLSGAMHYFRVVPEYWRDRLLKMKEMGLNTLETYVAWNRHEPRPGEFDFSGGLDLAAFVRLAGELGLNVIVRPGPSGTRLLLSDATAAVFDELAEQALDRLNVDVPDIDPEEIEETDPWPEGDLGILGDLGLGEQELSVLLADPDLYPDEQLQVIAERLRFDTELGAILDSLS